MLNVYTPKVITWRLSRAIRLSNQIQMCVGAAACAKSSCVCVCECALVGSVACHSEHPTWFPHRFRYSQTMIYQCNKFIHMDLIASGNETRNIQFSLCRCLYAWMYDYEFCAQQKEEEKKRRFSLALATISITHHLPHGIQWHISLESNKMISHTVSHYSGGPVGVRPPRPLKCIVINFGLSSFTRYMETPFSYFRHGLSILYRCDLPYTAAAAAAAAVVRINDVSFYIRYFRVEI